MNFKICFLILFHQNQAMKTNLSLYIALLILISFTACSSHKFYTSPSFSQQTAHHKNIAILPAEMIFTGTQPKNLSPEDIAAIETRKQNLSKFSLQQHIASCQY